MQRIWLLNFDADDELARPVGYTTPSSVRSRFAKLAERAEGLVPAGDLVITDDAPAISNLGAGLQGRAFCPTPRAIRVLSRAGVSPPESPGLDVLRRVNGRAFCAEIGQTLPNARFVRSWEELSSALSTSAGPWLLKRPFGFAGRGQWRLRDARDNLDRAAASFARASLEAGDGLQVEPLVDRVLDVALHGFLSKTGVLSLGLPTRQEIDERGAWVGTHLARDELSSAERDALREEAESTSRALQQAGYFGPFGIDGFRYQDPEGARRFNARSEINARYSMGWAVGMGDLRPDL